MTQKIPVGGGTTGSGEQGGGTSSGVIEQELKNVSEELKKQNETLGKIKDKIPTSGDIQAAISGEVGKITETLTQPADFDDKNFTSGDILNSLGFDFEQDPYQNLWLEITTGFSNALTSSNRSITVDFKDKQYLINLDDFSIQLPSVLKVFLTTISTYLMCLFLFKYIKNVIDELSSGQVDSVLNSHDDDVSNLF